MGIVPFLNIIVQSYSYTLYVISGMGGTKRTNSFR
jgi:hypothetical protein